MTLSLEQMAALRGVGERHPGLRWMVLFGSAARGEPHRDVDVAVMPAAGELRGAVELGRLIAELEEALGERVDVVDLRSAALPLAGGLLADRVVVLDRDAAARHAWEAETSSRWIDFRRFHEEYSRLRIEALRERVGRTG